MIGRFAINCEGCLFQLPALTFECFWFTSFHVIRFHCCQLPRYIQLPVCNIPVSAYPLNPCSQHASPPSLYKSTPVLNILKSCIICWSVSLCYLMYKYKFCSFKYKFVAFMRAYFPCMICCLSLPFLVHHKYDINTKLFPCFVRYHAMEELMCSSMYIYLVNRLRWVVRISLRPFYPVRY
jgi:hypothetical protein